MIKIDEEQWIMIDKYLNNIISNREVKQSHLFLLMLIGDTVNVNNKELNNEDFYFILTNILIAIQMIAIQDERYETSKLVNPVHKSLTKYFLRITQDEDEIKDTEQYFHQSINKILN